MLVFNCKLIFSALVSTPNEGPRRRDTGVLDGEAEASWALGAILTRQ